MPGPLLETKLHVPRRRPGLVARPRLIDRLSRGAESALTLVSAPAGFGKTSLLADWLAAAGVGERCTAWLSLDQQDNDPALFWTYLVAALKTAVPGIGGGALSFLESPQPPMDVLRATLINDLGATSSDVVVVLDDYHVLEARDVLDGMAFLVEHLPPQIHLVIASRADPALPLARLRGRGELIEIRAADLRFTPEEAAAYLNGVMGLGLTAADVTALEDRTEGWVAALQLAALSMRGRDDVAGFIAGFAGDDRYIVDYLVEEVLQRQSDHVRRFLLQTSILDRLSGPLCDAITGRDGGKAMLETLDRENLFLIPLDDRRQWYRYHHLFADVLQAHLLDEHPADVSDLHRRASAWYEQNGEPSEAIRHALVAKDFERAADLIELAVPATHQYRQEVTLRRWLEALPQDLLRVRPVLSNAYAGSLLVRGEVEGVESYLQDAERWLDPTTGRPPGSLARSLEMVVVDEEGFRALPASVAIHRAGQARILGDAAGTVAHARRALDLVSEDDHLGRGAAAALLGLVYWTNGDLDAARRWYADGMASLEKAGYLSDVVGGAITLADLSIAQGRLHEAMSTYQRGLRIATEHAPPVLRGAADMHVGMSQLLYERNELDAARQHLLTSRELGEHAGLPKNQYRWRVAMARIRAAEGDLGAALDLLNEADRLYVSDFSPDVRPVPALRAQVWVAQGRLGEALDWARERGLSVEDDVSYLHEFEHLIFARMLLACYRAERPASSIHEVILLVERILRAAEEGARRGSLLEILVVQALAQQAQGDIPGALAPLQRALTLAEPEGYVRTFVDEGPAMASLLRAAVKQGMVRSYVVSLLAAFDTTGGRGQVKQGVTEPLSERELDVLRLLRTDLDGPDIARELVVSLHTVRSHTKSIYAKLGVNNRRAAVRRAGELDLL
jgi:LuxR family transcriptional regulator, maltose regulon positive regulatory protein